MRLRSPLCRRFESLDGGEGCDYGKSRCLIRSKYRRRNNRIRSSGCRVFANLTFFDEFASGVKWTFTRTEILLLSSELHMFISNTHNTAIILSLFSTNNYISLIVNLCGSG